MMNIPYIVQIIIALLVFAMFCLAMFCISRPNVDADTHESFSTANDSHDIVAVHSQSTPSTETIANNPTATETTDEEQEQKSTTEKKNEEPPLPTMSQTSSKSNDEQYGYTIRDPSTWGMPQRHAPVCMPKSHPEIRPVYTDGVPMYALEVQTQKTNTK